MVLYSYERLDTKPELKLLKSASQSLFFLDLRRIVVGFTDVLPATPFFIERNEK